MINLLSILIITISILFLSFIYHNLFTYILGIISLVVIIIFSAILFITNKN